MTLLANWPAITDDSGTKTDGTIFNKALTDAVKASIEDNVHPTGSASGLKAKDTIQEVFDARGSQATLSARLAGALNPDGTLIPPAGQATVTQVNGGLGAENLIMNDDFLVWAGGDAAAPGGWGLTGAGATIARVGTGLGDTNRKVGDFAAKVTRAAADAKLSRTEITTAMMARMDFIKNAYYLAAGVWVKTGTGNQARIAINDGVTTTTSSYHTGSGLWQFLQIPAVLIGGTATSITLELQVNNSAGDVYFSGATMMFVTSGLTTIEYRPTPTRLASYESGTGLRTGAFIAAADELPVVRPGHVGILREAKTWNRPNSGASATRLRPFNHDGAAFQDIYASPYLETTNGHAYVTKKPDGTYRWRCFIPGTETTAAVPSANSVIRTTVDQVQATTVSDLGITYVVLEYMVPLEKFNL